MTNKRLLFLTAVSVYSLGLPVLAQDQTIQLTTSKSAGETMTLITNHVHGGITVDWGDGTPVAYETDTVTAEVKGSNIVVSAGDGLYSFNCAGNGISRILINQAPNLVSLDCSNNELSTLSLNGGDALEDLNCSNNEITTMTINTQTPNLKRVYASDNSLRRFTLTGVTGLEVIDVSNNELTSLSISSQTQLNYLDCSNNSLRSLTVSSPELGALVCSNNELTSLTISGSELPELRDVVTANNSLRSLNLSQAGFIKGIYCANNALETVTLPTKLVENATLEAYDCNNNKLTFASLPSRNAIPDWFSYATQAPFDLADLLNPGVEEKLDFLLTDDSEDDGIKSLDLSDYMFFAGESSSVARVTVRVYSMENGGETRLTSGSDYTLRSNELTFKKAFDRVVCRIEPRDNPYRADGFVLESVPFAVYPTIATGIDDITTADNGLKVTVNGTSVTMTAPARETVRIYSAAGLLMWQGVVTSSGTTVQLGKGVFLVGDKKVAL